MIRPAICLLLGAAAGPAWPDQGHQLEEVAYRCDGGAYADAVYVSSSQGSTVVLEAEGVLAVLNAGPSGSGVRYAPERDGDGYVWHTKGRSAFLAWQENGSSELVLSGCLEDG